MTEHGPFDETSRARLVPELLVRSLAASLRFWCGLIGFRVAYDRPAERFAYLDFDGAQVMLEEIETGARHWITGPLERPLGRGINFQIAVPQTAPILERLARAQWPLFMAVEEKWYRVGANDVGVRQFLVQDPDGYLLRCAEALGHRPA
ncbi:MAG: VOC family protein [Alphaproteobacteria bacterium]|nr:VOC family protein [Alphaproteobacteria bacterium]